MGRRAIVDGARIERIIRGIGAGLSFDDAAEAAGVSAEAWRRYRRDHPEAQAAAIAARDARDARARIQAGGVLCGATMKTTTHG